MTVPQRRRGARRGCGGGSAGRSASTRPGRRSTASAPTPRSGSPRRSCSASSTDGSAGGRRREAAYDALVRELLARERRWSRARHRGCGYPRRRSTGPRRAASGRSSGCARAGSTSSATSRTCARSGPTPTSRGTTRTGCRRASVDAGRRRAGRDDRGGRPRPDPDAAARPPVARERPAAAEPVSAASPRTRAKRRAWGWVHHLRDGGTTPWAAGPSPVRRSRRSSPAPSSSSCSAGSTWPARSRRSSPTGCSRPARPAAAGRTSSSSAPSSRRRSATPRSTRPTCRPTSCSGSRRRPARRGPGRRRACRERHGPGSPAVAHAATAWSATRLAGADRADLVARGRPPGGRTPGHRARHRPRSGCWPTPGRRAASTWARGRGGPGPGACRSRTGCPAARTSTCSRGSGRSRVGPGTCTSCSTRPRCRTWSAYDARSSCRPRPRPRRRTSPAGSGRCWACTSRPTSGPRCSPAPCCRGWPTHRDLRSACPPSTWTGPASTPSAIGRRSARWLPCARRSGRPAAGWPRDGRGAVGRRDPGPGAAPAAGEDAPDDERGGRMSKRVLLHVGTPKTGTSYLQDVLFRNRRTLAAAGILYPADRFDAHFLAALDLMRLPWGGLEDEAIGAWDRLAAQVRGLDGTAIISHEILATASRGAGRPGAGVARPPGRRGPRRALGARPGAPDPGGVAGERQAPRRAELRRFLTNPGPERARAGSPPGSGASRRSPTSSTAGATTCRPSASTWSRCRRPAGRRPAVEAVQPGLRPRRPRPRPRGRAREPVARRARDRAAAPDQPAGQPGAGAGATTGRWSASCSRTRPCRGGPGRRGSRCRPTCTPGSRSSPAPGSTRSRSAGTTWSATWATWSGAPPQAAVRRPRPPRRERGRRRRGRRDQGAAARERPAARDRAAAARELDQAHRALSGPTCADVPLARARRAPAAGQRTGRGLLGAYRRARGRSSRSA